MVQQRIGMSKLPIQNMNIFRAGKKHLTNLLALPLDRVNSVPTWHNLQLRRSHCALMLTAILPTHTASSSTQRVGLQAYHSMHSAHSAAALPHNITLTNDAAAAPSVDPGCGEERPCAAHQQPRPAGDAEHSERPHRAPRTAFAARFHAHRRACIRRRTANANAARIAQRIAPWATLVQGLSPVK